MKRIAILVLAGLAAALAAGGAFADGKFPMQAKAVAPNVYAIVTPSRELPNPGNRGWNSNSAFVVTKAGVIVFDTGSSAAIGSAIKETVSAITDQPVRWIVNSHSHGDHWLGNSVFKGTVEAIYASAQVKDRIAANGESWVDRFHAMTEGATGRSPITPPDTMVGGKTDLVLGGVKVSLLLSGDSHSPGDVLMWLPENRVLVAGDVVYSDRMPSTGDSNLAQWIKTLDEIVAMNPGVVVPGHGKVTDPAGVKRLRDLLQAFWSAVERGFKAGKLDYQMAPEVTAALSPYGAWYPGLAEKVKRDIQSVYLQVEDASFN